MTAQVLQLPVLPSSADILFGRPVRGPTLRDISRLANHILGRGAQLVPWTFPQASLSSATAYECAVRAKPRYQATQRAWFILARASDDGATLDVQIPSGTGTTVTYSLSADKQVAQPFLYLQDITQSATEAAIVAKFTPTGAAILEGFCCVEVPRAELATSGDDLGLDIEMTAVEQPIWGTSNTELGLYRIANAVDVSSDIGRRVGHFAWSVPHTAAGSEVTTFARSTTSGSATKLFELEVPMLGQALNLDNSTEEAAIVDTLTIRALAKNGDGSTAGRIDLTATSGDTATLTCAAGTTTWTWLTADTFSIDSEDLATTDGLRGSTWDDCSITFQRTAGASTFYVAALMVWRA